MKVVCENTDLVCLECGNVNTICRKKSKLKSCGHIKHMYCYNCQKICKHYEVRDISSFLWKCYGRDNLSCDEKMLMELLLEREKRNEQTEFGVYQKILKRR